MGMCGSPNVRCSYTSSVTMRASCRWASSTMSSSVCRSSTVPVGLCGSLTMMSRVRSVTAPRRVVVVGPEAGGAQRNGDVPGLRQRDDRGVGVVERLEGDDLVALLGEREDARRERLGRTRGHENLRRRIERQAVEALLVLGDGVEEHAHPTAGRVLVDAVADRLLRGLEHLRWAVLFRKALAEIDGARRGRQRGHLREDGWPQLAVRPEEHRAARCALPCAANCHSAKIARGRARGDLWTVRSRIADAALSSAHAKSVEGCGTCRRGRGRIAPDGVRAGFAAGHPHLGAPRQAGVRHRRGRARGGEEGVRGLPFGF